MLVRQVGHRHPALPDSGRRRRPATGPGARAAAAPHSADPLATPPAASARPAEAAATVPDAGADVLYFAYGANMDPAVLRRRGVAPASATPAVLVSPRNLRLAFAHRAAFATLVEGGDGGGGGGGGGEGGGGGGAAAGSPAPPHGVLYGLDGAGWAALARAEAGYRWVEVEVAPYGPRTPPAAAPAATRHQPTATARAFVSTPLHRLRGGRALPPPRPYLARLVAGARARGLDPAYCAWLEGVECAPEPGGRGLPGMYYETPARDVVLVAGAGLAAGMVAWALAGGLVGASVVGGGM